MSVDDGDRVCAVARMESAEKKLDESDGQESSDDVAVGDDAAAGESDRVDAMTSDEGAGDSADE